MHVFFENSGKCSFGKQGKFFFGLSDKFFWRIANTVSVGKQAFFCGTAGKLLLDMRHFFWTSC